MSRPIENKADVVEALATVLCKLVNIAPVDPMDGSPNWWMFNDEATKIADDLAVRFKPFWAVGGG